jgi:hypothetical protein
MFFDITWRRKAAQFVPLVLMLLCLPSCWVFTTSRLYFAPDDPDLIFDQRLIGTWGSVSEDACSVTLRFTPKEQAYEVTAASTGECKNKDGDSMNFEAHLVKLGTHLFLDLRHEDVCGVFCLPLGSILLVQLGTESLSIAAIDSQWLKKAIEQKTVSLQVLPSDPDVLVASTQELKNFARKYADDKTVFKPAEHSFHRIPAQAN